MRMLFNFISSSYDHKDSKSMSVDDDDDVTLSTDYYSKENYLVDNILRTESE